MSAKAKSKSSGASVQVEQMERDLGAIRQAMRRPVEAEVAQGGLTVPQKAVMQIVVHQQGISLKDLSRRLSLAHSTVSGIVDRLEMQGLIERRTDQNDRRISRIHPTEPVAQFIRDKIPALTRGPLQAAMQRATPAERNQIEQALHRLRELLDPA